VTDCSAPFGFVKMALAFDGVRPEDINDVSKLIIDNFAPRPGSCSIAVCKAHTCIHALQAHHARMRHSHTCTHTRIHKNIHACILQNDFIRSMSGLLAIDAELIQITSKTLVVTRRRLLAESTHVAFQVTHRMHVRHTI
jgi:hypothetical protein